MMKYPIISSNLQFTQPVQRQGKDLQEQDQLPLTRPNPGIHEDRRPGGRDIFAQGLASNLWAKGETNRK
jgi:hypothetical protein